MAIQITGSWNLTGSYTASQGFFGTASYATYALSASYAPGGGGGAAFPYTGSAQITGSLTINGIPSQFTSPNNSPFVPIKATFNVITGSTTNIHISESGVYKIQCTSTGSGNVNVYYWLDLLPTASEYQIILDVPADPINSSPAIALRTLVTASNSTSWWAATTAKLGNSTQNYNRLTLNYRRFTVPVANSLQATKNYDGSEIYFGNAGGAVVTNNVYYLFSGSSGTPL